MKTTALFKYIGIALFSFLSPIFYAFIFTIILVGVDTITGIMKAGKDDIKNVKSKKGFSFVPKLIFYFLLVLVAHACALWVDPQIPFVKLVLVGIGWIEVKSIDENFEELFGFSFINKALAGMKAVNQIKRHKD